VQRRLDDVVTRLFVKVKSCVAEDAVVNPVKVHPPALELMVEAAVGEP
jgi:hypothetical protein